MLSGFKWADDGTGLGTGTSTQFSNCYVFGAESSPYDLFGLTYSGMDTCAADAFGDGISNVYAYRINICTAFTMVSCGCETSAKGGYADIIGSTITINSPKSFNLQADETANIKTTASSNVVINTPLFSNWVSVTGNAYDVLSQSTGDDITVNSGRFSANSTQRFSGAVKYNTASQDLVSGNIGDTSITLVAGIDEGMQRYASTLTANRVVTLTAGAWQGAEFTIVRYGGAAAGAFTLDVGGLYTIPASVKGTVVVKYDATGWKFKSFSEAP